MGLTFKYDLRGVIKLIKRKNYNIIHVHLSPVDIFAALTSLFLPKKIKWIFSEHSIYNRRRSFKIFKNLDNFNYSRYSKIVCVSKQVESTFLAGRPLLKKKKVIPNAVTIPKLLKSSFFKTYDILFVGRLTQAKGIDILLKAIKILNSKYNKKLIIAIVGDGSLKENINNLSINLGIRKDIIKLMDSTKMFVPLSR